MNCTRRPVAAASHARRYDFTSSGRSLSASALPPQGAGTSISSHDVASVAVPAMDTAAACAWREQKTWFKSINVYMFEQRLATRHFRYEDPRGIVSIVIWKKGLRLLPHRSVESGSGSRPAEELTLCCHLHRGSGGDGPLAPPRKHPLPAGEASMGRQVGEQVPRERKTHVNRTAPSTASSRSAEV